MATTIDASYFASESANYGDCLEVVVVEKLADWQDDVDKGVNRLELQP